MTKLYDVIEESYFVEPVQTVLGRWTIPSLLILVVAIVDVVLLVLRKRRKGKK